MEPIIKKISDQFSRGNFKFAYSFMSDTVVWNIAGAKSIKGKADVVEYCDNMLVVMVDSTLINTHYTIGENAVAVQGYCTYTSDAGQPGRLEYCDVYHFKDDRLQEISSYCIEVKSDPDVQR